jgi:hypothetical protein
MSVDWETGKHIPMTFLDTVRTLRKERDMTFEAAKAEAIRFWLSKGWELPQAFKQ